VVALAGDDPIDIPPLAETDGYHLAGKGALGHTADTLQTEKAIGLDPADHEAGLIHMGEQKHVRPTTLKGGPEIA